MKKPSAAIRPLGLATLLVLLLLSGTSRTGSCRDSVRFAKSPGDTTGREGAIAAAERFVGMKSVGADLYEISGDREIGLKKWMWCVSFPPWPVEVAVSPTEVNSEHLYSIRVLADGDRGQVSAFTVDLSDSGPPDLADEGIDIDSMINMDVRGITVSETLDQPTSNLTDIVHWNPSAGKPRTVGRLAHWTYEGVVGVREESDGPHGIPGRKEDRVWLVTSREEGKTPEYVTVFSDTRKSEKYIAWFSARY